MEELIRHAFEAGRRGKPDEFESTAANLLTAYFLEVEPESRFDIRVCGRYAGRPVYTFSGEVSRSLLANRSLYGELGRLVVDHYNAVHKTRHGPGELGIEYHFTPQSGDLAANMRAGDSGTPIAVAYRRAPLFLPWERYVSVSLRNMVDEVYQADGKVPEALAAAAGVSRVDGLRADGKLSVEASYLRSELHGLDSIVAAVEHEKKLTVADLRDRLGRLFRAHLDAAAVQWRTALGKPLLTFNGRGPWPLGGVEVDGGSREAKPYRDGFASYGVCEDSFSGEDPTKPSATGTFMARWIAVEAVGSGLAEFARVELSYIIGEDDAGLNIWTDGTGVLPQEDLHRRVRERIPLRIQDAIERFGLRDPALWRRIAANADFFHDPEYPWNQFTGILKEGRRSA